MELTLRRVCSIVTYLLLLSSGLPWPTRAATNPIPVINNPLVPSSTAPGGPGFTLTVNGSGFVSGATVYWNGTALATVYVSGSQLSATVLAAQIASAGTAAITVVNPPPGGGKSNVVSFDISSPVSTLTFSKSFNIAGGLSSMAAADFNGDGKLDLAAAGVAFNSSVAVQLGNGDGSFQMPVNYSSGEGNGLNPIVAADFNGDGKLDIAVISQAGCFTLACPSTISVLLGNGDGTFQLQTTYQTADGAQFLLVGDFNGDGKLDLVTGNNNNLSVSVLLGNGDGTFQSHVDYPLNGGHGVISSMVAGDFNGDGKLDLACVSGGNAAPTLLSVLLGKGDGSFQTPIQTAPPTFGPSLITADVNGDGKLDLVMAADYSPSGLVYVFLGNGDGSFQPAVSYAAGDSPGSVAASDLNADGKLDLVVASEHSPAVSILPGNGDGTFQSAITFDASFPGTVTSAQSVAYPSLVVGDFNRDGRIDVAVLNTSTFSTANDSLTVLLQGSFPAVLLTPLAVLFDTQGIGTTSRPQTVTLTNTGNTTLTVSSIAISGANAGDFAETSTCSAPLAPGATCQVSVTFTPTAAGNPSAVVSVTDNGPGSPQTVALSGSTPPAPAPILAPLSVVFPNQYVGTSGLPQTVTVTNTGSATLTITTVTANPADFGVLSNCTNPVPINSSCTIGVFFDPTASGTRTGTLTITDNAGNSPQTVTLTGSGQDFSMAPGSASSATVSPGQTASYSIAIAPAGGFTQSVALSCGGAPAQSTCSVTPKMISLSGTTAQTAMVMVTTAAHGSVLPVGPTSMTYRPTPLSAWIAILLAMVVASLLWRQELELRWAPVFALVVLVCVGVTLTSCGGGSGGGGGATGTQAGTYTITVTGNFSSGSTTLTHAANLTLVVQ
jgi:hypothetical protein